MRYTPPIVQIARWESLVKPWSTLAAALLVIGGCSKSRSPASHAVRSTEDVYVITAHTVVQLKPTYLGGYLQTGLPTEEDDYAVAFGQDILKVKYAESITSTANPGDAPGTGLHQHSASYHPDLSWVPQVGTPIRRCSLSKSVDPADGDPIIGTQPTSDPCMVQIGDQLMYLPSPNTPFGPSVTFDVVSEKAKLID